MNTARFLVTGCVQGVGFRAATAREARGLGLRGLARNLRDGRVEVIASGDAQALERLADWLRHGPPHARVDAVERATADAAALPLEGFETA